MPTGLTDGATKWVRVTAIVSGGTATVTFFLSDDAVTWTQLGDPVSTAAGNFVNTANQPVAVGGTRDGTATSNGLPGTYFIAAYRTDPAGAPLSRWDFTNRTPGAASFVESSGGTVFLIARAALVAP